MGRGRAKAKQTKVARQLKYSTPQTDWERLQSELKHDPLAPAPVATDEALDDELEDDFDEYDAYDDALDEEPAEG